MNQHAVPQNVTGYQFRLIGDMTIQQFIYLSIGIGAAIFFYYTNLFSIIKWFFILMSALMGFAVAFMPLEERPLDQWIVNYIKAIYKPTRFIWRKNPSTPAYFTYSASTTILPQDSQEVARAAALRRQQGLRSFLVTLPSDQQETIDQTEKSSISSIEALFSASSGTPSPAPIVTQYIPQTIAPEPVYTPQVAPQVAALEPTNEPLLVVPEAVIEAVVETPTVTATTSSTLPFPSTPSTPNTVVGMVLDNQNHIISNAIVEVVDESGIPVRATKTNQLGQFFSTTPLRRGIYHITIEKDGYSFDTIELELSGQIIEPLKIISK
jgi:hypothetical protein